MTHRRRVDLAIADERPRFTGKARLVGHPGRCDAAIDHVQRADLNGGAGTHQGICVARESPPQEKVEAEGRQRQGCGDGDHDGEQQTRSQAEGTTAEQGHGLTECDTPRRAR